MKSELRKILERQHYKIVGEHSAVKTCHWLRQKLLYGRPCYKEVFYGIQAHRCLQMTPTVNQCTQNCLYCWRYQKHTKPELRKHEDPEFILDNAIEAQKLLISGFKGNGRCSAQMYREAYEPNQVAISLAGEPTLYPRLGEFIKLCKHREMTTFLVTNGTTPEVLEHLTPLPTQLYITIAAPNIDIYKRLCNPLISDGWERIHRSLQVFPSLSTRRVIRHTLVKGWNLGWVDNYAKLDSLAEPDFIECKAYMYIGYSRERMRWENMPSHLEIKKFAKALSEQTGYEILSERKESRVVLLGRDKSKMKIKAQDI